MIDHALNLDLARRRALRALLDAAVVRADLVSCERAIQERLSR